MRLYARVGFAALLSAGVVLGSSIPSSAAPALDRVHPVVSGLSATVGDVMGGQHLTIRGAYLETATQVCFGQGCVPVEASKPNAVQVTTPPHFGYQAGQANAVVPDYQKDTVQVSVELRDGTKITARPQYRYDALTRTGREMSYVIAHWDKYDSTRYGNFNTVGGDCVNFVSGGLTEWLGESDTNLEWYNSFAQWVAKNPGKDPYKDPYGKLDLVNKWATPSWAYVPSFSAWMNAQKDRTHVTRTDLSSDPDSWVNIRVGDIMTITWNHSPLNASAQAHPGLAPESAALLSTPTGNDLGKDHAMIVTRITTTDGHRDIQLAGHNNDRNYLSLTTIYASTPHMTGSIWHLPVE